VVKRPSKSESRRRAFCCDPVIEGKVSEKNEGSGMSEREKPSRMVVSSGRGGALEWAECLIFYGKLMVKRGVRGVYSGGVVREMRPEEGVIRWRDEFPRLRKLTRDQRAEAYRRYEVIRACMEEGVPQTEQSRATGVSLSTIQRWIRQYKEDGLCGLARKPRADRGTRRNLCRRDDQSD
jgi:transposase-like protein